MGLVKNFEELKIWQLSRQLVNKIYDAFYKCADQSFNSQITRAAISTMNNIAEGFERCSKPEFKRFLIYSRASCSEIRSMLYIAEDRKYINKELAKDLRAFTVQLNISINALIKSFAL